MAGLGLAPMPHKNTHQDLSFLSIWVKQDFSGGEAWGNGALECWQQRKMLQQCAASTQLAPLKGTTVNPKEPLRPGLDLRARTRPGAVDPPKEELQPQQQQQGNKPSSG